MSGGLSFCFDCKVVSGSSLDLHPFRHGRKRQWDHLRERSRLGAVAGLLVHFNLQELKRSTREPVSVWIPVVEGGRLVDMVGEGGCRLHRDAAKEIGRVVEWHQKPRWKYPRPKIVEVIQWQMQT